MEERQTETSSSTTQQTLRSDSRHENTLSPSSSSSSSSSSAAVTGAPGTANGGSWWDSMAKSRTSILSLSSLLPPPSAAAISSLSNSDHPSPSLLSSAAAYAAVSLLLSSSSTSGSGGDPLCKWLYENLQSPDPDLSLFVLSLLPLLSSLYLSRVLSDSPLSGFEAVLLAIHGRELKSRAGRPLLLSIPDLSHPSIYHTPTEKPTPSPPPNLALLSPPLHPQTAMKSTRRAHVVGVALEHYYKRVSHIPAWSKLDFCRVAAAWAGQHCRCKGEIDYGDGELVDRIPILGVGGGEEGGEDLGVRIQLPWELLQPCLRIISHCLLSSLNSEEVKEAAGFAARVMYARASHDLVPRAMLATRSLVQLDARSRREKRSVEKTEVILSSK